MKGTSFPSWKAKRRNKRQRVLQNWAIIWLTNPLAIFPRDGKKARALTRGTMGLFGFIQLFPVTEELRRSSVTVGSHSFMFLVKRIPAENEKFVSFHLSHAGSLDSTCTFSVEEFDSFVDAVLKAKEELEKPNLPVSNRATPSAR
jgi:hypothetical protein